MSNLPRNFTFTLGDIRAASPCQAGWKNLLAGIGYMDGPYRLDYSLSLGDVARVNNAVDAQWCFRLLDWSDIAVRRAVIAGSVLPAVRRAAMNTTDQRLHDSIDTLTRWCSGDDEADLPAAHAAARRACGDACAAGTISGHARAAPARAVHYAISAAYCVSKPYIDAYAAFSNVRSSACEFLGDAAYLDECKHQRADIIAAFPPVALPVTATELQP